MSIQAKLFFFSNTLGFIVTLTRLWHLFFYALLFLKRTQFVRYSIPILQTLACDSSLVAQLH